MPSNVTDKADFIVISPIAMYASMCFLELSLEARPSA